MTQEQIQNIFKQRYNQANWKQFLGESFANALLLTTPETLPNIDTNVAINAQKLGFILLNQNGIERQIAVYEVTLAQGIILERNRVGLRNLLRKYWKDIDAAFIVYHQPESSKWRFTYVSELSDYDATGEYIKVKTEPKRYTYVLGEGESTRTAAQRFSIIATKGKRTTLDDVKEAFSVEKLSKSFFDEYKKHYDIFCDFMVAKPSIRQAIFNGDEKAIRDFNKKLLGRVVFLYFIQKKGWLGVPLKDDWGKGDFNFLTNQFNDFRNQNLFYQEFLSVLFFETLNCKRDHDIFNYDNVNFKTQTTTSLKIPYLNGGLFEEDNKNHRNLIFPANMFSELFNFFNQYNFTIYEDDPNDHTVAVDPEMLGHIFENLLEDNKDKGAFYTPKEIVHYMCQESLIEYLATWFVSKGYQVVSHAEIGKENETQIFSVNEGRKGQLKIETVAENKDKKIDRLLIEKLLKKKLDDTDKKLVIQYTNDFNTALDTVKICDPAIGSGAFPMGLLHSIFTAKQTLHTFVHGNTTTFDASGVKLNIIQNSIYGVDIEKGAVDIARLRFWLSLIVDEPMPKALPNLDYKIVVGNSLVSKLGNDIVDIDWELKEGTQTDLFGNDNVIKRKALLTKISNQQKDFFNPTSDKHKLAAEIRNLKIDLLVTQFELMIKTANQVNMPIATNYKIKNKFVQATQLYHQTLGWIAINAQLKKLKTQPELSLNFFDWKLDFPEVMNESVVDSNNSIIAVTNAQIVALNKQIDVINIHLSQHNIDQQLMHLQANIAQSQIAVIKNQLDTISNNISTIYGTIIHVDNSIVYEPDLSLTYQIKSINNSITDINATISLLSQQMCENNSQVGFDIVIGNPPYGATLEGADINYFNEKYKIKTSETAILFIEKGLELNNTQGLKTFIIPKSFTFASNYKGIRDYVENGISLIADCGKAFENVKLEACIISIFKSKKTLSYNSILFKEDKSFDFIGCINKKLKNKFGFYPNGITGSEISLGEKVFANSIWLNDIATNNRGEILQKHLREKGKFPVIGGKEINKYGIKGIKGYIIDDTLISSKAKIGSDTILVQNIVAHITKPYEHLKIIACIPVKSSYLIVDTINQISIFNSNFKKEFIWSLLTSKLLNWYCYLFILGKAIRTIHFDNAITIRIPIPNISSTAQNPLIKIVDSILHCKSEGKDTTALEQQIDNLVYKLYELSYEEVKIIDPEFSLTKNQYEAITL